MTRIALNEVWIEFKYSEIEVYYFVWENVLH